jgi:hypothetical protein
LNAREKLFGLDRLGDVVISPEQQPGDAVRRIGPRAGEEDDRQLFSELVSQLATYPVAARFPQHDVEEDDIRPLPPDGFQSFLSSRRLNALKASALAKNRYEFSEILIVVDDQK